MKTAKAAHIWHQDPFGWYVEPERVTSSLIETERFEGITWDPSCGGGNIPRAFMSAGLTVFGTDVVDRGAPTEIFCGIHDFLGDEPPPIPFTNIVCNPPFFRAKGTEAFARKALSLATGKVAIFSETRFLMGGKRGGGFYREHPPTRVWLVSDRPSCPPGTYLQAGGKAQGGTPDFCWIVWSQAEPTDVTQLRWLVREIA